MMLIPLTWEGFRTIPIPLDVSGVQVRPLSVGSLTVRVDTPGVFRITAPAHLGPTTGAAGALDVGTVQVDASTGLIRNLEMNLNQQGVLHRQQMNFNYYPTASPATQPQARPTSGGR